MESDSSTLKHLLIKTVVPPSAVRFLEQGCFRSPAISDLLFGRVSALELVTETSDGELLTISEQLLLCAVHDLQLVERASMKVRGSMHITS